MASELHSRLEYLVNYSSQLIFVSGDTIAEQQRTLESFVFQQSDNTELAFITAEPSMTVTEYRGTLCKQLLGQVVGSYIRPLNELLAGLNHHAGPVLITITQAQHIPNSFLQELWELVLQSRFANNKQHLNVLLFGESEWAEQAKEWLPAKNTSTPLLISSQSFTSDDYSSDVDRLLAERRAAFERYRKERGEAGATPFTPNRLRSPWLWLGITLVFVSCFVAIMGWQYGTTITTLFNPIESQQPATEQSALVEAPAIVKPTRTLSVVKQDVDTTANEPPPAIETDADSKAPSTQPRVISSFNDALKALPEKATTVTTIEKPTGIEPQAVTAKPSVTPTEEPVTRPATEADTATTVATTVDTQAPESATSPREPAATLPLANAMLLEDDNSAYWVQIAGMKDHQLAADFLRDNDLTNRIIVYQTYRYGGDWYVLLWAESAPSLTQAQQQLAALPTFPGSDKAFIKSARQIKAEIANQQ
ncbi:SPOR domain-containing protein [Alteromonas lipolytica]|uniref:SPOR domain-containing protein n=1 Tax=Alteromonas lipolytica TaxID=1856405 RepID=A0A1E8FBD2_9ALTE|nr:hypothetical protein [Alteromonas lipolytica]OFI33234.1 hypothetical protein BFC17_02940 [Alteromonas lipolytica]GGF61433.1 hypothetical protein GCM10011338_12130 [Alteromonas lipolytica]